MTGRVGRMRVLVTGAAGYTGSVATAALLEGGHESSDAQLRRAVT